MKVWICCLAGKTTNKTCPIKDNIGIVPTLHPSLLGNLHPYPPPQPGTASAQTICSCLTSGDLLLQEHKSRGPSKAEWITHVSSKNLRKSHCLHIGCCWFSVKIQNQNHQSLKSSLFYGSQVAKAFHVTVYIKHRLLHLLLQPRTQILQPKLCKWNYASTYPSHHAGKRKKKRGIIECMFQVTLVCILIPFSSTETPPTCKLGYHFGGFELGQFECIWHSWEPPQFVDLSGALIGTWVKQNSPGAHYPHFRYERVRLQRVSQKQGGFHLHFTGFTGVSK